MFAINTFIEVQVVGLLLLLALSPVALLLSRKYREDTGLCPPLQGLKPNSAHAVLLVVAAFVFGVAGNRVIDDLFDEVLHVEGKEWYAQAYACMRDAVPVTSPVRRSFSESVHWRTAATIMAIADTRIGRVVIPAPHDTVGGGPAPLFKEAEYHVSNTNEAAQAYFDRHKLFMRVLHGVTAAMVLALLSMLGYDVARRRRSGDPARRLGDRYPVWLYVAVSVAAVLCFVSYRREALQYYERVCELSTGVEDCVPFAPANAKVPLEPPSAIFSLRPALVEASLLLVCVGITALRWTRLPDSEREPSTPGERVRVTASLADLQLVLEASKLSAALDGGTMSLTLRQPGATDRSDPRSRRSARGDRASDERPA